MRSPLNILLRNGTVTPDRLPGLAAWYSADYGVLTQVGGGTAFASGNSQYLSVAHTASLSGRAAGFTVCGWIKSATVRQNSDIILKGDNNAASGFDYILGDAGSGYRFTVSNGSSPFTASVNTGSNGAWAFVVGWYSQVDGKIYCQVNGGTATETVFTGTPNAISGAAWVGGWNPIARYMNGSIDEVSFHSRVLTSDERTWLYNSGSGRTYSEADAAMKTNLVSWWSMNAPASGNWLDQHGSNHLSPSASRPTATTGVTFRIAGEGETVRRWLDRSGNGRHLEQTTFVSQPTITGGRISFNGASMMSYASGFWSFAGGGSVFWVANPTAAGANTYPTIIAQSNGAGVGASLIVTATDFPNAGKRYTLDAYANRSASKENGILLQETSEGFSWTNWQTGSDIAGATGATANAISSTGSGSPASLASGTLQVGSCDVFAAGFLTGTIAEIVCYTKPANPAALARYFAKKWGVQL